MATMKGKLARVFLVCLASALVAVACAPDDSSNDPGSGGSGDGNLSGEIAISGSSTVEPITSLVAEDFSSQNPDVKMSVDGPGTTDGFVLFCKGDTDISDASRPIEPEEIAACKKKGIDFIEVKVGIDGITVMTNPDNKDVTCLDFHDLYALLGPESEGFKNWSDANKLGEEIGAAHVPYPDVPLDITAPGEESGTYDSFGELVLQGIAYDERGIKEDDPVIRPDYHSSADDNVIIRGIEGSSSSLGWVGFAYYEQAGDQVKAISIAEKGDNCVGPTTETIGSGEYPISRELYFYVNADSAKSNDAVSAFVDYYLSDVGIAAVSDVGYVDLPTEELQSSRDAWDARETGTRES